MRLPRKSGQIHFRVTSEEERWWRTAAKRLRITLSDLVRKAVSEYLERRRGQE